MYSKISQSYEYHYVSVLYVIGIIGAICGSRNIANVCSEIELNDFIA